MDGPTIGLVFTLAMLALMFLRVPIAVSMMLAGGIGYVVLAGFTPFLASLKTGPYFQLANESFTVIPLFLLMGFLASHAGISRRIFEAANAFLGHLRGGLCVAAIGGCAFFGAICGSSLATAATMGQVALPEMRRYGYDGALATGTLAAGGTLGILIPPSIPLIVYAILAEQNIAKLFVAAFLPGILATLGYMTAVAITVRLRKGAAPAAARSTWRERACALVRFLPVSVLFLLVVGGIYSGVFTPTEAAAVGTGGVVIIACFARGSKLAIFRQSLVETAVATGMIFMILIGADIFNSFIALSGLPQALASWIVAKGFSPMTVMLAILVVYLIMGCLMDSLSMILLTIPIFFPVVIALDFGLSYEETALWFGILVLIVVEVGLITPPVGMNVFVINKIAGDVPMRQTFKGIVPFLLSDFLRVALLLSFPVLSYGLVYWLGW
ncbi:MAG TPA: TRAP transporter large permease [Kiloniellales bacterium]|nr:TRAP transporter large permease [Kiloniellales bacterium]